MRLCSIEGCGGKHKGYGFCLKHYQRFKTHGDPMVSLRGLPLTPERQREYSRKYELNKQYGLSIADYQQMATDQNDACAICGTSDKGKYANWCVDHNHDTGEVRGLLCRNCNAALGLFQDNVDVLTSATVYLLQQSKVNANG